MKRVTVGAIVLDVFLLTGAISIIVYFFVEDNVYGLISIIVSLIIIGGIIGFQFWYYGNTASGNRALKTQESDFNNGIERVVTVYDIDGKVIQKYEGKFDVTYDSSRILFDDENGKRHVVYYTTGTVTIDEK